MRNKEKEKIEEKEKEKIEEKALCTVVFYGGIVFYSGICMVEFVVKQEGEKRRLVVNCKGLPFGPDVAQFPECMRTVIEILKTVEAHEVVLSEFYERIYNEEQTRMLKSISDAITRFETEAVWSPSHLGTTTDSKIIAARHEAVTGILSSLYTDPFGAYLNLLKVFKAEDERSKRLAGADAEDSRVYKSTLNFMREILEASAMIQRVKGYLAQLGAIPTGRGMYVTLFETAIKPSFIGSRIFFGATEKLELIDQYNVLGTPIYIYKHPDQVQPLYYINPPEYTLPPEKYFLLEKTKEVVAGRRPEAVGFMDMAQARKYFHKIYVGIISDLAVKNKISLTVEEKEDLATIVTRYTIGYGVLEILLSDRQLTDTYLDSPLGVKPIYVVHSKYGQCQTNVIFSEEEARAVVSRFRALSGRPFDEAHPILDFDLTDLMTRVCVIGKPLATDGIAFAFRLHKTTPWTLPQFLDVKMMNPLCAGMLSMFVDAQASMLIVGSRGSGKCVDGDTLIQLADGRLEKIRDLVESQLLANADELLDVGDGVCAPCNGIQIFTLTPDLKIVPAPVSRVWRRQAPEKVYQITFSSGKKITCTPEHPFFVLEGLQISQKRTDQLRPNDYVAAPLITKISLTTGHKLDVKALLDPEWQANRYWGPGLEVLKQDLSALKRKGFFTEIAQEAGLEVWKIRELRRGTWRPTIRELVLIARALKQPVERYLRGDGYVGAFRGPTQGVAVSSIIGPISLEYARFLGLLIGDGHLNKEGVHFTNMRQELREEFRELAARLFGLRSSELRPKHFVPYIQVKSSVLAQLLRHRFEIPFGSKLKIQKISAAVLRAPEHITASFLQGYADCDGYVMPKKTSAHILLCSRSREIMKQVQCALLRFGIHARLKEYQHTSSWTSNAPMWRLFLYGENCDRFAKNIGFRHPEKRKRLQQIVETHASATGACTRTNTIPNLAPALQRALADMKFSEMFNSTRTDLGKGFSRGITRERLMRIGEGLLQIQPQIGGQCMQLASSQVLWDAVVDVKTVVPKEPQVYDLTVEGTHSFVANGIVVHNTSFLQAMILEIPQNLRIIVQEDSVTGDCGMVVESKGRIEKTTVSKLVDNQFSKYGFVSFDGREISFVNPDHVKVFALEKTGKIKLREVRQFIRHKVSKDIYLVETRSGKKIKVTGDHSLFTLSKGSIVTVKTNELKPGDEIVVSNVDCVTQAVSNESGLQQQQQRLLDATLELDAVSSVINLGKTNAYVYDFSVPECENFVCENIVAHNTLELPVPYMKTIGYNIQRLKTRPPLGGGTEAEPAAEDALRTALRLGDSVLIVGEVRSKEAAALYEAMRVGAVGNVVMGTIHGESAYSIWDRVVNDLGVPTTSFKATDFCVVTAPIRFKGALKRERRVIGITEVKKHWEHDPHLEGGFLEWMQFDATKDDLELFEDNIKESEWIERVRRVRGLTFDELWAEINARGAAKQYLVEQKRKYDIPKLLESDYTVRAHNKYMLMADAMRAQYAGKLDHAALLAEWKHWLDDTLVRELVAAKRL